MHHGAIVHARNVNHALPLGLSLVRQHGQPVTSRGLPTLEVPGPVMTVYSNPWERVLHDPVRDANPFFHFFESMWILAGANTTQLPSFFLPRLKDYSDDGVTFHGAYGYRLRNWWGEDGTTIDQLEGVIQVLKAKPDTRQAVMSIWSPELDLGAITKDVPCNDMVMFKVRNGALNMTVCNRSNDVIWGAYGANAVQFSVLQEYVAASVGLQIGTYTQVSDSYHVYEDLPLWQKYLSGEWRPTGHVIDPYQTGQVHPTMLFSSPTDAAHAYSDAKLLNSLAENDVLQEALFGARSGFQSNAFKGIGLYMLQAFFCHRAGDTEGALRVAGMIKAEDWRMACDQWLCRRIK